jgi:hypothetical protein
MPPAPKVLPETPVRPSAAPGVADVWSDVLRVIHLSGAIFFHADVAAPYESEAAFNRAFRRQVGEPPAAWRAKNLPPPAAIGGASFSSAAGHSM